MRAGGRHPLTPLPGLNRRGWRVAARAVGAAWLESGAVPQGRLMGESEKLIADFERRVRDALVA